jgi:hypothetical protein
MDNDTKFEFLENITGLIASHKHVAIHQHNIDGMQREIERLKEEIKREEIRRNEASYKVRDFTRYLLRAVPSIGTQPFVAYDPYGHQFIVSREYDNLYVTPVPSLDLMDMLDEVAA